MSTVSHMSSSPTGCTDANDDSTSPEEPRGDNNNRVGDYWLDAWQFDLYDNAMQGLDEELAVPPVEVDTRAEPADALAGTVVDGGRLKHVDLSEPASNPAVCQMRSSVLDAFEHRNQILRLGFQHKIWQIAAASELLLGRDVMVVTGTGSGKSMCYLLTVMAKLDGIVMVLSPLLSLMEDQVNCRPCQQNLR
jgi:superfamily II RNA helicase